MDCNDTLGQFAVALGQDNLGFWGSLRVTWVDLDQMISLLILFLDSLLVSKHFKTKKEMFETLHTGFKEFKDILFAGIIL